MKSPLKVAAAQIETTDSVSLNTERVCRAIEDASVAGADLVSLPECVLCGYPPVSDFNFNLIEREEEKIRQCAMEHQVYVAFGTARPAEDGMLLNTAVLLSPEGDTCATYDKTELTEVDESHFLPGERLEVVKVGEWTVALQICFDMRFPENWRILRLMGAELVIHIASASRSGAWKVPVLEGTMRCRAAENGFFVLTANDAREPQMMVSQVCNPLGQRLASARLNRQEIIYATLNRSEVRDDYIAKRRTDLWGRREQKGFFFCDKST